MENETYSDPFEAEASPGDANNRRKGKKTAAAEAWKKLTPKTRRCLSVSAVALTLLAVAMLGYANSDNDIEVQAQKEADEAGRIRDVELVDTDMIEKTLYAQTQSIVDEQRAAISQLREELERLKTLPPVEEKPSGEPVVKADTDSSEANESGIASQPADPTAEKGPDTDTAVKADKQGNPSYGNLPPPIPGNLPTSGRAKLFSKAPPAPPTQNEVRMVGGIEMVSSPLPAGQEMAEDEGKKKVASEVYLPPSFMEATTLSGLAAPTTQGAGSNPLPILLRIQDLAVLPNKVKANLKGCFVIGEGVGNLADERVHVRLKTLSCVSRHGASVIDQPIKGWVVDSDSRVGLKGRVTARMGVHIARSALAGLIDGIGEGVSQSTQQMSFGGLGNAQSIFASTDATSIAKSGIGEGISKAAGELQKFYLQLAEATLPVIEVGSRKNVTIVISEGLGLKIQEKNISG